jgi:hypothetical protein
MEDEDNQFWERKGVICDRFGNHVVNLVTNQYFLVCSSRMNPDALLFDIIRLRE